MGSGYLLYISPNTSYPSDYTVITISIDNSYSKVTGLSADQEKALKKKLSYVIGGSSAYFSKYGPRKGSLLGRHGDFPTGLLHRVEAFLRGLNTAYKTHDLRKKPCSPTQTR